MTPLFRAVFWLKFDLRELILDEFLDQFRKVYIDDLENGDFRKFLMAISPHQQCKISSR